MSAERKKIRDAIAQVLQSTFVDVFKSRSIDARELESFVNVYFDQGDIEFDGLRQQTTATLVIAYHCATIDNDDHIDDVSDQINKLLSENDIATDLIQGFYPVGFQYADEKETAFSGIFLRYEVIY